MMQLSIHDVTRIELRSSYVANSNSRTVRIVSRDPFGNEQKFELVVYGNTDALDALPRAEDFRAFHGSALSDLSAEAA